MKRLVWLLLLVGHGWAGAQPHALHPHLTIDTYLTTSRAGVRLAHDPISQQLFYADTDGSVFRLQPNPSGPPTEVLVAGAAQHGIGFLQGMAFADSTLVLVGIRRLPNEGVGRIVKGKLRPDGSRHWTVLLETDPYPYSNTAYDHAFNGLCISPDGDLVYVNSGSRTDHGEVQDNGGQFPGLRETPLTARVFKVPLAWENRLLPNDDAALRSMGVLFCEGVRNTFDMAFNAEGRLFGTENAGQRSDPEELNWLRTGRHYGFPWVIGGNLTPQQFPGYDPLTDPLLSPWYRDNSFRNDPTYPPPPPGIAFTPGLLNTGPDARQVLDPATGQWVNSDTIRTFNGHASPLGLVFDTDSLLADFAGQGFVLGYSPGRGLDLSALQLTHDSAADNYRVQVKRIAAGFSLPVDAELVDTTLYVLERGRNAISRVRFRARPVRADLSLRMETDRRVLPEGAILQTYLTVSNHGPSPARNVRIGNRVPAGLQFVAGQGIGPATATELVGWVGRLGSGQATTLTYLARATEPGTYRNAAEITQSSAADPDSEPNTGTADGEDDMAVADFRTLGSSEPRRESANPNGRVLPPVQPNQPPPNPNRPDLSLGLVLSQRVAHPTDVLTLTLTVGNDGGQTADNVQLRLLLPASLIPEPELGWAATGPEWFSPPFGVGPGQRVWRTLQIRIDTPGPFVLKATLLGPPDADSTPNNGYDNGEDDEAAAGGRGER
jgi:uncharacterized repeat protein (TIGR01451 family)